MPDPSPSDDLEIKTLDPQRSVILTFQFDAKNFHSHQNVDVLMIFNFQSQPLYRNTTDAVLIVRYHGDINNFDTIIEKLGSRR